MRPLVCYAWILFELTFSILTKLNLQLFLKDEMNAISTAHPALKPWVDKQRDDFLVLFDEYYHCQSKGPVKKA